MVTAAVLAVVFGLIVDDLRRFDHEWFWRKWRGDRKGHRCRILARGNGRGPRNILVQFIDGERVVAPRWAVRKARSE
jgi:hypothetical protein